jgi:hypothetical protein
VCDSVSIIEKQSKEELAAEESEDGLTGEELHFQHVHCLQVRVAEQPKQEQQVLKTLLDASVDSGVAPDFGTPSFRSNDIGY